MLCLTRKVDEAVRIGDGVRIVIVEIRGDRVRLGIDADRDVPVHREEIYQAIRREKGGEDPCA